MRSLNLLAASLILSACTAAPRPAVVTPRPIVVPPPAPLPPAPPRDWKDRRFSNGSWTLEQQPDGLAAWFGRAGHNPDFRVTCISARRMIGFARAGSLPELMTTSMVLASTDGSKAYTTTNSSGTPAYILSETAAADRQLDSLAFSRGRILVAVAGTEDLVLPSWPEFARVVETCRTADASATALPQPPESDAKIN